MTAPMSEERLAEIRSVVLTGWLGGRLYVRATYTDEKVTGYTVERSDGAVIARFPEWAESAAVFLADAHEAVPELLADNARLRAEVARLTPAPKPAITRVRVRETEHHGWSIWYRLHGKNRRAQDFPSKPSADDFVDQLRKRHGDTT
jgi:hypothetical protein